MSLKGKRILITGGGQGIGRGMAALFLVREASVMILDRDAEALTEAEAELQLLGPVLTSLTDTSEESSVIRGVERCLESFGGLDGLVNNAGVSILGAHDLEDLPLTEWNRVLTTNLTSYMLMAKHCCRALRASKGAMVNIASTRALQSEPRSEAYAASKGGVVALTHAMAATLAPDVRVNCISPGWIDVSGHKKSSQKVNPGITESDHSQHWSGRVGRPGDVASVAAFLLSEEAVFVTGHHWVVDGGMTRKMIYA